MLSNPSRIRASHTTMLWLRRSSHHFRRKNCTGRITDRSMSSGKALIITSFSIIPCALKARLLIRRRSGSNKSITKRKIHCNLNRGFRSCKFYFFARCFRVFRTSTGFCLYLEKTQRSLILSGFFGHSKKIVRKFVFTPSAPNTNYFCLANGVVIETEF